MGQNECVCGSDTPSCVALTQDPIDPQRSVEMANGFKALADPHRIAIVHVLAASGGPVCVVDIERHLDIGQSTVSYHLKTLVNAGILTRERRGKWSYYTLDGTRVSELVADLDTYSAATVAR